MPNEEGSVSLKINLDTKGAMKEMADLGKKINKVFSTLGSGQGKSPKLQSLQLQAEKSIDKIQKLRQEIADMEKQKPSAAWIDLQKRIAEAGRETERLQNRQQELINAGRQGSTEFASITIQLRDAEKIEEQLAAEANSLIASGKDLTTIAAEQPKEYQKANEQLRQEEINLTNIQSRLQNMPEYKNAEEIQKATEATQLEIDALTKKAEELQRNLELRRQEYEETKRQAAQQVKQGDIGIGEYIGTLKAAKEPLTQAQNDYNRINQKLAEAKAKQENLNNAARQQSPAVANANREIDKQNQKVARNTKTIRNVGSNTHKVAINIINSFKRVGNSVSNAFDKIKNRSNSTNKSVSSAFGNINDFFKRGLKTLIKYGLGMRSFFFLFRRLRSAIMEGYKELAKYSKEVDDSVVEAKSALLKLRNSVVVAIQPLVKVLAPVLASMANKLADIFNKVAQVLAALTGQDYVYQATKAQATYAQSLEDTAEAAKKSSQQIQKYLSPLDDINLFTANKGDNDTTDEEKAIDAFATNKIENKFKNIANRIKDLFNTIFKPIKKSWEKYGKKIINNIKAALNNIKKLIKDIYTAWITVWSSPIVQKLLNNIALLFSNIAIVFARFVYLIDYIWTKNNLGKQILEKIVKILDDIIRVINNVLLLAINKVIIAFKKAWEESNVGEKVLLGLLDIIDQIVLIVEQIGDTFHEVFTIEDIEAGITRVLNLLYSIVTTVQSILTAFSEAWEQNDNGRHILENISSILITITDALTTMFGGLSSEAGHNILVSIFSNALMVINNVLETTKALFELFTTGTGQVNIDTETFEKLKDLLPKITGHLVEVSSQFTDFFSKVDVKPLFNAAIKAAPSIVKIVTTVLDLLSQLNKDIVLPIVEKFVNELLPALMTFSTTQLENLSNILESLSPLITGIWEGFLKPLIDQGIEDTVNLFQEMGPSVRDLVAAIANLLVQLGELFGTIGGDTVPQLLNIIGLLAKILLPILVEGVDILTFILELVGSILEIINGILEGDYEKVFSGILNFISAFWTFATKTIKNIASLILKVTLQIITNIVQTVSSAVNRILIIITGLWKSIVKLFTGQAFSSSNSTIGDLMRSFVNRIFTAINDLLFVIFDSFNDAFNSLRDIEVAGFKPMAWLPTWTTPQIPLLAQGAVIPAGKPFMAMLGDQNNGKNLEAPESLLRQIFREENANGSNAVYNVNVQVGRQTLLKLVLEEAKLKRAQTGQNPLYSLG